MNHAERLEWDHQGKCKYKVIKRSKCTGPYWSDKCVGHYTDEYGTSHWCTECTYGNGITTTWKYIRVPEFDAPKPKDNWIPDWIET